MFWGWLRNDNFQFDRSLYLMPIVFNLGDIICSFFEENQNLNPRPSIVVTIVVVVVVVFYLFIFFLNWYLIQVRKENSEEFNSLFGGHKCFEVDQILAIFSSIEIDI